MTTATLTVTETEAPSRSKAAGPCWIAVDGTYASPSGREITAEIGSEIQVAGKLCLRKRSGGTYPVRRGTWTVRVTGDADDVAEITLAGAQSISATITGAVLA